MNGAPRSTGVYPFYGTRRNCPRCGKDFAAAGNQLICASCRKPKARGGQPPNRNLSPRQKQVVTLVREAKANKEIAASLHLTEGTVKQYLWLIFRKLGVENRTALAMWAGEQRC
ncbi:MAG: response regulator transcription factor [Bryobacteraceae bacterium]|jgi:DNA-binding NarL/FixJ family response regulator